MSSKLNIITTIIILLITSSAVRCQQKNYTSYRYGDSILIRNITKNLFRYHEHEIIDTDQNAVVIAIISISKEAKIDSVNTLNSSKSSISMSIIDAIKRTKNDWLNSTESCKIIIPVYILHDSDNSGQLAINCEDLIPANFDIFPIQGILLKPIFIKVGPRISHN